MSHRTLPMFPILDLIGPAQLDQYLGRTSVPCYVADAHGKWLSAPPANHAVCDVLSEVSGTASPCTGCIETRMGEAYRADGPQLRACEVGTYVHVNAVRVADEVVGYVWGPLFRLEPFSPQQAVAVDRRLPLDRVRYASAEEVPVFHQEVDKLSKQLARRYTSERTLRLLNQGVQQLAAAPSETTAINAFVDTVDLLFLAAMTRLYLLDIDGELHLASFRNRRDWGWGVDRELAIGDSAAWRAFAERKIVSVELDQEHIRSVLAVPLVAGPDHGVGVLEISSDLRRAFTRTEIQSAEILASSAALAVTRGRLEAASRVQSQLSKPPASFTDKVIELMLRRIDTGQQRARARFELFEALVKQAHEASNAIRGSVRSYNSVKKELAVANRAGLGWTPEKLAIVHKTGDDSAGGHAVTSRQPYLIDDVTKDPNPHYKPVFADCVSNYALPILLRGEVAALLTLQAGTSGFFTPELRYMLRGMVAQTAEVLERLADIQTRWLAELETAILSATTDVDVCRAAVRHVRKMLGAYGCSIFLINADSGRLELVASTVELPREAPSYDIGEGITGVVAKTQRILRIDNVTNPKELEQISPDLQWGNKTWYEADVRRMDGQAAPLLAAPLVHGQTLLGVVRASLKEERDDVFDVADELALNEIAHLLAARIATVNASSQSNRRIENLAALVGLNKRLAATLDVNAVCASALDEVRDVTGCVAAHIRFLDGDGVTLRRAAAYGPYRNDVPEMLRLGEGVSGAVAKNGAAVYAEDVLTVPAWHDIVTSVSAAHDARPWVTSGACVPLVVRDALVGTLLLEWSVAKTFDDERTRPELEELAARCANAVHGALTYQDKVKNLARIRAAGLQLTEIRALDDLLDAVLDNMMWASAASDAGFIRLLDETKRQWVLSRSKARRLEDEHLIQLVSPTLEVTEDFLEGALRSPRAILIPSVDARFQAFRERVVGTSQAAYLDTLQSILVLPLWTRRECIGFVSLTSSARSDGDAARLEFLETLAAFAAVAVENARLLDKERTDGPLAIMGAMTSTFLHRARTPLQAIKNRLGLIELPTRKEADIRTDARALRDPFDRLHAVLRELERFGRVTRGESTEMHSELTRIVDDLQPEARRREVSLMLRSIAGPGPRVHVSADHLDAIVTLLVLNSFNATPKGGDIVVETQLTERGMVARVSDTGSGMTPEVRERCMEIGFSGSAERDGEVRGLGLTVVGVLVRHNNGRIQIDSEPGRGTSVSITFSIEGMPGAQTTRR